MAANFTHDEINLMCIYDTGSRTGLIAELKRMLPFLDDDEAELREMTNSVISKLTGMTNKEFEAMELIPDFEE